MDTARAAQEPLLVMNGVEKSFPGVHALKQAHLDICRGEVLALLGENGAGKSTLIKVLAGAHAADSGTIRIDGVRAAIASPLDARRAGIAVIYQEFNLVPTLTARENIFLGRETTAAGFCRRRREHADALALFDRIGVRIDPEATVRALTIAQQQVVEIAKALSQGARIIVMDEPSATLTRQEVEKLFAVIRELKAAGIAVIYISHRLDEVFEIADRATVMRDGETVDTLDVRGLTRERLIEMMVGRKLENEFPKVRAAIGPPRLEVEHLSRAGAVRDVSFHVRRGEVLGLTGLVGSGRTEVARLVVGAARRDGGTIRRDGRALDIRAPRDAIRHGICLLNEDRKAQGLVLGLPVRENFSLPNLGQFSRLGFVRRRAERAAFARRARALHLSVPHDETPASSLSGGNQQKLVLAKWLESNSEVILFDEPTRGIDIGAKYEIYLLMNDLAARGKSILMISSELPEVLGMSDRILVMHEGRLSGEIVDAARATQPQILALAMR